MARRRNEYRFGETNLDDWDSGDWEEQFDRGRFTDDGEHVMFTAFAANRWDTKPRRARSHS